MTGRHAARDGGEVRRGGGARVTTVRSRLAGRWRELTGSASKAAVAFGLLACTCSLMAVAGPRASAQLSTHAFRQLVAQTPAADKTVIGTTDDGTLSAGLSPGISERQLLLAMDLIALRLQALPLAPARAFWSGLTTPLLGVADNAASVRTNGTPQLELTYRSTLAENVRVVAGRMPAGKPTGGSTVTLQAAVTVATARRFGLDVGSAVPMPGSSIVLHITGIVQPVHPSSPFWSYDPLAAVPSLVEPPVGNPFWDGGAFIPGGAVIALQDRVSQNDTQLIWNFPLDLGRLTGAQAIALQRTITGTLSTAGAVSVNRQQFPTDITMSSYATSLLTGFAGAYSAVTNVLDLLSVSLAVVGAAVVLLAAWLLAEKRRAEFAVLRARGASRLQLAYVVLGGSAIAAVPGVAIGVGAAVALTPGAVAPLGWWLAGLIIVVCLAGPVLITTRVHRGYVGAGRPDQPLGRMSSARRLVIEAGLTLASVGGLIVLRDQGLGRGGGDLYPSAAPILVAIPVAIIILRIYPLLVRTLLRLTGRRAGATAFLGLASASRVPASAVLPAFALVLALALVSFAGMVRGAVVRGDVAASWQQAGADAVISEAGPLTPAQQRTVAGVAGVRRTAAIGVTAGSFGSGRELCVVVVDPAQYAAYLAATPLPQVPAGFGTAAGQGRPVDVLASPSLAAEFGNRPVTLHIGPGYQRVRVTVVGQAASLSAVQAIGGSSYPGYVVLPAAILGASAPAASVLLVAGSGVNRAALIAAASRHGRPASILFRSGLLATLQTAPLQHGAYVALALGGGAAAAGAMLVLLLTLLLTAPSRQLTLARMNTMGMSTAQGRRLALIEALPQILSVLVGGLACAAALAPLVGPALSLAVFTGSGSSVPVRIEPALLAATAAGLLVLAIITLAGQTMLASHQIPRSLRIGG